MRISDRRGQSTSGKAAYRAYLQSQEWQEKREAILDHYGRVCASCHGTVGITVHHLRYASRWGDEELCDFRVLCWTCHKRLHQIMRGKERQKARKRRKPKPQRRYTRRQWTAMRQENIDAFRQGLRPPYPQITKGI